jgi:hypothetical protein
MTANLLVGLGPNFCEFSECLLINNANHLDFDSAIRRFESSHPSQPVRSLWCDFQVWENRRHSRGLAGNGAMGGSLARKIGHLPPRGAFSWTSLCCMNFQYPEFDRWCDQRPVAFWQRRVRRSPGSTSASSRPVLLAMLGCGRNGGSERQCNHGYCKAPINSHACLLAQAKRAPGARRVCPVRQDNSVAALLEWAAANIVEGSVFRSIRKGGKVTDRRLSAKSVCDLVKKHAGKLGLNQADFVRHMSSFRALLSHVRD